MQAAIDTWPRFAARGATQQPSMQLGLRKILIHTVLYSMRVHIQEVCLQRNGTHGSEREEFGGLQQALGQPQVGAGAVRLLQCLRIDALRKQ